MIRGRGPTRCAGGILTLVLLAACGPAAGPPPTPGALPLPGETAPVGGGPAPTLPRPLTPVLGSAGAGALPAADATAVVTLPPALAAPPAADAFYARLAFTPPLAVPAFTDLVRASGVLLLQVGEVPAGWSSEGSPLDVFPDTAGFLLTLNQAHAGDRIPWALVRLDHAQAARLPRWAGVTLDLGTDGLPSASADPVVARWQAAAAAMRTLQFHLAVTWPGAAGAPAAADPAASVTTDALYDLGGSRAARRFRITSHRAGATEVRLWDGVHGYDYRPAVGEVYRAEPESPEATLSGADLGDLAAYLYPARAYNLLGPRAVDGRPVLALRQVLMSPSAGAAGSLVALDVASSLPYQISPPGGGQYTFTDLTVNPALRESDFAPGFPADTVTIWQSGPGAMALGSYPTAAAAAAAVGFPLYAPPDERGGPVSVVYEVEQRGTRSPVVELAGGHILEGRYLPQLQIPPQHTTLAGHAALRQDHWFTFTLGATQVRISEGPFADFDVAQAATHLELVR